MAYAPIMLSDLSEGEFALYNALDADTAFKVRNGLMTLEEAAAQNKARIVEQYAGGQVAASSVPVIPQRVEEAGTLDVLASSYKTSIAQQELRDVRAEEEAAKEGRPSRPGGLERAANYFLGDYSPYEQRVIGNIEELSKKVEEQKQNLAAVSGQFDANYESVKGPLDSSAAWLAKHVGRLAADPKQALPTVGGTIGYAAGAAIPGTPAQKTLTSRVGGFIGAALGAAPMAADAYTSSYIEAKDMSASPEQADEYAAIMTGIEFGTEALSGGLEAAITKLGRAPVAGAIKQQLQKRIAGGLERTAKAAAVSGAEEAITEPLQDAAVRAMQASGTIGLTTATPTQLAAQAKELEQRKDTLGGRMQEAFGGGLVTGGLISVAPAHIQASVETANQISAVRDKAMRDLIIGERKLAEQTVPAEIPPTQVEAPKWQQAEEATALAAEQKRIEEEAGFRTIERERFAEEMRAKGAKVTTTPVTPEQVLDEELKAAEAALPKASPIADESVVQEPATPAAEKPTTTPRKGKKTVLSPEEEIVQRTDLWAKLKEEAKPPADTEPALKAIIAEDTAAGRNISAPSMKHTAAKVHGIITQLTKNDTQTKADVRSLITQGKLQFARSAATSKYAENPKALTVGAFYDPATTETTVFLDRIKNDKNATSTVLTALHEATHAGQYNNRQGRPEILKQLMGAAHYGKANEAINTAAKNGNAIAKRAVTKAVADGNTEHETAAYFASEVAAARAKGTPLGTVGWIAKDMVASTKNFLREHKIPLNVTISDLAYAAKQTAGEVARTNLKPTETPTAPLAIVAGPKSTGYAKAKEEGKTFDYEELGDKRERFEINDREARLRATKLERAEMLEGSRKPTVKEWMDHPELAKNYPALVDNIKVVVQELGPLTRAQYDHNAKSIVLNSSRLATATQEELKQDTLHEMQHAIQAEEGWLAGANPENFIPKSVRDAVDTAKSLGQSAINKLDLKAAVRNLPASDHPLLNDMLKALGKTLNDVAHNDPVVADAFLREGFAARSDSHQAKQAQSKYDKALMEYTDAQEKYFAAENAAYITYLKDLGEAEARNVEARMHMRAAEREQQPFKQTLAEDTRSKAYGIKKEDIIDTHPEIAKARSSSQELLAMAAEPLSETDVEELVDDKNWVGKWWEKKRAQDLTARAIGRGRQWKSAGIAEATTYANKLEEAINATAAVSAKDEIAIKKELLTAMHEAQKAKGLTKSVKWNAFRAEYPDLAMAVLDFRDHIDNATQEIINSYIARDTLPTRKELTMLLKLHERKGSYLATTYAAFTEGGVGRVWADARMKAFVQAERLLAKGDEVPTNLLPHYSAVSKAINFFMHKLDIPTDQVLIAMKTPALIKLHDSWMGKKVADSDLSSLPKSKQRVTIIQALQLRRTTLQEAEVKNAAISSVKHILGLEKDGGAIAAYISHVVRDPGALKKKVGVPPPIGRLLGKLEDPVAVLMNTLARQKELIARANTFAEIKEQGIGKWIVPIEDMMKPDNEKFRAKLDDEKYGMLSGYATTEDIKYLIDVQRDVYRTWVDAVRDSKAGNIHPIVAKVTHAAVDTASAAARLVKAPMLLLNPWAWIRNAAGSPLIVLGDGNISLSSLKAGIDGAGEYIASAWTGNTGAFLLDLQKYIELESVDIGDIQERGKALNRALILDASKSNKIISRLWKLAGHSYATMDNWAKIANWVGRTQVLEDMYKAMGVATRDAKDNILPFIKKEAGDDTNFTNLTYSRSPRWVRGMERVGASMFANYFAEVFRTTFTGYVQVVKDLTRAQELKNKGQEDAATVLRVAGTKRLIGHTLARFGAPAITYMAASALAGDEEDNKWRRLLLGPAYRDQDIVLLGRNSNGMPVYANISAFDPFGPLSDLMRSMLYAPEGHEAEYLAKGVMDMYIAPTLITNTFRAMFGEYVPQSKLEQLAPALAADFRSAAEATPGVDVNISNRILQTMDPLMPGILKSSMPHAKLPALYDEQGRPIDTDALVTAANKIGMQVETFNPVRGMQPYAAASKQDKQDLRSGIYSLLSTRQELTLDTMLREATSAVAKERERLASIREVMTASARWGYAPKATYDMMLTAGFDKTDVNKAFMLPSPIVDISLGDAINNSKAALAKIPPTEQAKMLDNIKRNYQVLQQNAELLQQAGLYVKEN